MKQRIHDIMESTDPSDGITRAVHITIFSLIVLNIVALVIETVPSIGAAMPGAFQAFEVVSVIVFTVEYLLRLWSCTADERFRHPVFGRLSWALTPMALIDLLVILPFWLPLVTGDLRFLRVLRLLRLLRIAKLGRYSRALQTIRAVVLERKAELATSLTFLLMLLLVASCLMYYVEHEAQPEKFPSIPAAAWWAIATLTTVGYGDVTPVTGAGKLIAGIVTILGICMLALPTAILGAGFLEHTSREAKAAGTCPHCGRELAP